MSGAMARQTKATAEWIYSKRVLVARDGNVADVPPGDGFERHTVVEAKLWAEPTNAPDSLEKPGVRRKQAAPSGFERHHTSPFLVPQHDRHFPTPVHPDVKLLSFSIPSDKLNKFYLKAIGNGYFRLQSKKLSTKPNSANKAIPYI